MDVSETAGKLYVVATPIGNLGDFTRRAVEVLSDADFIAAEDTRVTGVLLTRFGIRTPMLSYHKFNENGRAESIIEKIMTGQNCALVTDAGTPGISDPGAVLVQMAAAAGIETLCVPGPSAVTAALSICGFEYKTYGFYGFLPKGQAARNALNEIIMSGLDVFVIYESPHRITGTVKCMAELEFPSIAVCNDLTKKFERVYRGKPSEILEVLHSNPNTSKGEYVLVAKNNRSEKLRGGMLGEKPVKTTTEAALVDVCVTSGVTLKEAVSILREGCGDTLSKKEIYAASLNVKKLFANLR